MQEPGSLGLRGFGREGLGRPRFGRSRPLRSPALENRDRSFVPTDDAFFIRSPDDGLNDRGIQCGDLVLVNPSARAREGEGRKRV